jgi:serine/threonine-protein kinase
MHGFSHPRRSEVAAIGVALLVVAATCAAPLQLPQRLDRLLFDAWTHLWERSPPSDMLVVKLSSAASFPDLLRIARAERARLVVAALADAPPAGDSLAIGPTYVPLGSRSLRRTDWQSGGHLSFEPDIDGVVRADRRLLDDALGTESLASYAAHMVGDTPTVGNGDPWLRFYPGPALRAIPLDALLAEPARIEARIVVATEAMPLLLTPIGPLMRGELVAQMLAAYRQGEAIVQPVAAWLVPWLLVVALLAALASRTAQSRTAPLAIATGFTVVLTLAGVLAFGLLGVWVTVAGPVMAAWLACAAIATGTAVVRPPVERLDQPADLGAARRIAGAGRLVDAWAYYRQIAASPALLPELYELGCALRLEGHAEHAADLFHRIALVDQEFRDVAKHLAHVADAPGIGPATAELAAAEGRAVPGILGRYQVLEPIGRGAMGYVYLGRDPMINRIVALKVIDLAEEFDATEIELASASFLREAEVAGRLSHPNIVTIYDVGEQDSHAYIAMEYLKGRHLSEFAAPDTLLPVDLVLELLSLTADALDYAHAENVVHRDIKPANIMYDSISGGLKITDFGIAKLIDVSRTRTGIVLGTPAFMSPEQLEGHNVNGHTDLFALGVSLYQLLTGHLPFRGASMTKLMFVIANEPHQAVTAVRPGLPPSLDAIVDRALAKDPAERFRTGAEMAAALRQARAAAAAA